MTDSVTKALLRRDVFSVRSGSVVLEMPPIAPDELTDVLAWLELMRCRLQRDYGCFHDELSPLVEPATDE